VCARGVWEFRLYRVIVSCAVFWTVMQSMCGEIDPYSDCRQSRVGCSVFVRWGVSGWVYSAIDACFYLLAR